MGFRHKPSAKEAGLREKEWISQYLADSGSFSQAADCAPKGGSSCLLVFALFSGSIVTWNCAVASLIELLPVMAS